MTRIYLDPTALVLPPSDGDSAPGHVAPGSVEAVRRLLDAGFEVVLLGDPHAATLGELPASVRREPAIPDHLEPEEWYLTGEPNPVFGRPRGGTIALVGPKRPVGKVPQPRFDLEARDMPSAAMEILTRQAMA